MIARVSAGAAVLGSTLIMVIVGVPASAAVLYSVSRLPFIPADINDRGQVVGQQYLWDNGSVTDLRTLPRAEGSSLVAKAINNQGLIIGDGLIGNGRPTIYQPIVPNQAFRSDGKTISDLGFVAPCKEYCDKTSAIGLTNQGQIAFTYGSEGYDGRGVLTYLRQPDGSFTKVLDEHSTAINNAGQVVGYTPGGGRSGPGKGLIADASGTTLLTSPGYCSPFGSFPCFSKSTDTTDINDNGQVVGYGPLKTDGMSPFEALLWKDPHIETIGEGLPGLGGISNRGYRTETASLANSLNNSGEVVGLSYQPSGQQRAVIWKDATIADLNEFIPADLGWSLTEAIKINNQGQIVGKGYLDGAEQGFLLTLNPDAQPIPEPDSPIVFWACAGVLGTTIALRYRKAKVKKVS